MPEELVYARTTPRSLAWVPLVARRSAETWDPATGSPWDVTTRVTTSNGARTDVLIGGALSSTIMMEAGSVSSLTLTVDDELSRVVLEASV